MNTILIYILIIIGQLLNKMVGDWWYKKYKKRIINHAISSGIDIIVYIIAGYFFLIVPNPHVTFLFTLGVLILTLSMRWLLYDLLYNLINKHPYNHLGESAYLDIFLKWVESRNISQYNIKGILVIISISLIIWF